MRAKKKIGFICIISCLLGIGGISLAQEDESAPSDKQELSSREATGGVDKDAAVRISGLEEENKLLKDQLDAAVKEGGDLKKQLLDQEKQTTDSQNEKTASLEAENKRLKDEIESIVKERDSAKERLSGLGKACGVIAKEKAMLQAMCQTLSAELHPPELVTGQERNFNKVVALNLGYAYGNQGKLGEALNEYRKALAMEPSNKDIHYNIGYLLAKQKKYKQAIDEYVQSLKGSSQDADVYSNLAVIYATALKDQKTADGFYRKSLEAAAKKDASP